MKLYVGSSDFVNSLSFVCLRLQRPIFKMSVWNKKRFINLEGTSLRRWRMPYSFCKPILKEPRIQAFFMSRLGREARQDKDGEPRQLGTDRNPRKSKKSLNLFVPDWFLDPCHLSQF